MNYTIATLESPATGVRLDLAKRGNGYVIHYSLGGQLTSRMFDDINEAYKMFEKLSSWIIYGLYAHNDRRQYLLTDTMD